MVNIVNNENDTMYGIEMTVKEIEYYFMNLVDNNITFTMELDDNYLDWVKNDTKSIGNYIFQFNTKITLTNDILKNIIMVEKLKYDINSDRIIEILLDGNAWFNF